MRWTPGGESSNIEDRRGQSGGGIGGIHLGIGGTIIVLVLSLIFHRDFFSLLSGGGATADTTSAGEVAPVSSSPAENKEVQFVSFVLDDVQHTWTQLLPEQAHIQYQDAKLVLFRNGTQSGCGFAQTAMGPFYCPEDKKVYIDLGFYDELRDRFGAPGDFAQAYVLAHEIGHHVQDLEGIDSRVRQLQEQHPQEANHLSVLLELQADCYAGIWGHSTQQRQILEQGDIEEGLNAAAAVGDDRLQRETSGHVSPDSFTHGTSQQRAHWFKRGFDSGALKDCDTFSGGGP